MTDRPWFGSLPDHWDVLPARALFHEVLERGHPDEPLLSVTIGSGVIEQRALLAEESKKDSSNEDKSAYKLVKPGDIAYNKMRAWQGAVGLSDYRGIVSPAYVVMRPRTGCVGRYLHYLLRTPAFATEAERWSYGISSDQWSLRPQHFKMIRFPIPSLMEQDLIVRFLDQADQRIQRAIHAKQRLIALLNEQKQAVIHYAITRGLDPNVRLRPSGVDWPGDVPEHWTVSRLSQFLTLQRGYDITQEHQRPGPIPVVSSGGVSSCHDVATASGPGVVVGRKGTAGSVYYIASDYWAHDTTLWVRDFKSNCPRFIYYLLKTLDLKSFDTGSANPTLNRNLIHPVQVAFPPTEEQDRIARHIDAIVGSVDSAQDAIQREIGLLGEYRTRLIDDIVTGRLDVRAADSEPAAV